MRKHLTLALVLLCFEILQVRPLCAQAAYRLDAIVLQGQSAPGTGGGVFSDVTKTGPPAISGLGEVLFVAGISGGTTPSGLFLFRAGSIIPIALAGQPAPGTQNSRFKRFYSPRIHHRGEISFVADLDPFVVNGFFVYAGLFVDSDGLLSLVSTARDLSLKGFGPVVTGGDTISVYRDGAVRVLATAASSRQRFTEPTVNKDGAVAFIEEEGSGDRFGGIFLPKAIHHISGNKTTVIARHDQLAPGTNQQFSSFSRPVLNDAGMLVFWSGAGLFRYANGSVAPLVLKGQPLDGTPIKRLLTLSLPSLNDVGSVAFLAIVEPRFTAGYDVDGVFVFDGQKVVTVAKAGQVFTGFYRVVGFGTEADQAPGTGGGTFSGFSPFMGYHSLNDLGAIAFQASVLGGTSGSGIFTATPTSLERKYFSHFASGGGTTSELIVINPTAKAVAGSARILDSAGRSLSVDVETRAGNGAFSFTLPAYGAGFYKSVGAADLKVGSVELTSSAPLQGTILFGGTDGLAGVPATQPVRSFLVPIETDFAQGIDTGVALSNPSDSAIEVALTLRDASGSALPGGRRVVTLPAGGQLARFAREIFDESTLISSRFSGVLEGDSSSGVNAMALLIKPREFATLPVTDRATTAQELHFPHIADGEGITSTLVLVNPSATKIVQTTVELTAPDGSPMALRLNGTVQDGPRTITIPPLGVALLASDGLGVLKAGAVRVSADAPVGGTILFGGSIGVAAVAASELSQRFLIPVEADSGAGIGTGIALHNPSSLAVSLKLQLRDAAGALLESAKANLSLPPRGQSARFLDEVFAASGVDLSRFRGTLEVDASAPVAATAIRVGRGQLATLPTAAIR